jgi:hypothetical protein
MVPAVPVLESGGAVDGAMPQALGLDRRPHKAFHLWALPRAADRPSLHPLVKIGAAAKNFCENRHSEQFLHERLA